MWMGVRIATLILQFVFIYVVLYQSYQFKHTIDDHIKEMNIEKTIGKNEFPISFGAISTIFHFQIRGFISIDIPLPKSSRRLIII